MLKNARECLIDQEHSNDDVFLAEKNITTAQDVLQDGISACDTEYIHLDCLQCGRNCSGITKLGCVLYSGRLTSIF